MAESVDLTNRPQNMPVIVWQVSVANDVKHVSFKYLFPIKKVPQTKHFLYFLQRNRRLQIPTVSQRGQMCGQNQRI